MFCSKCGTNVPAGVAFCPNCGQATGGVTAAPAAPVYGGAPVYSAPTAVAQIAYAGFWLRFVAVLIDSLVIGFGAGIVGGCIGGITGGLMAARAQ